MSILAWIVLGAIAGYLAGFLVKGDEGLGMIGHIVLGIVGALVGGFLAGVLFNTNPIDGPLDISSIVTRSSARSSWSSSSVRSPAAPGRSRPRLSHEPGLTARKQPSKRGNAHRTTVGLFA